MKELQDLEERFIELSDSYEMLKIKYNKSISCNGCIYEKEDNAKRHNECYECSRLYFDKYKAKDKQ